MVALEVGGSGRTPEIANRYGKSTVGWASGNKIGRLMISPAHGSGSPTAGLRILVVEDELMISMLCEGMLAELGHEVAGTAASIEEASRLARFGDLDGALLDVNLNGQTVDA